MPRSQRMILKDVSLRVGLPYEVILKVWRNQWLLLKKSLGKGTRRTQIDFPEVYIRGCGRFKPMDGLITRLNKAEDEKRNGNKEDRGDS